LQISKSLIDACKSGKREAQKILYETISARLFQICLRYAPNSDDASDILHDSFITILTKVNQYDERGDFMGWSMRITVNTALQWLRKNKKLKLTEEIDEKKFILQMDASDRLNEKMILNLISKLPAGYRTVFNLYAIEGYDHSEVGEMMGISESTSRSQFARARALLQKYIQQEELVPVKFRIA
jgi:RNA polymerase sigma factor (sigma-70 family)